MAGADSARRPFFDIRRNSRGGVQPHCTKMRAPTARNSLLRQEYMRNYQTKPPQFSTSPTSRHSQHSALGTQHRQRPGGRSDPGSRSGDGPGGPGGQSPIYTARRPRPVVVDACSTLSGLRNGWGGLLSGGGAALATPLLPCLAFGQRTRLGVGVRRVGWCLTMLIVGGETERPPSAEKGADSLWRRRDAARRLQGFRNRLALFRFRRL